MKTRINDSSKLEGLFPPHTPTLDVSGLLAIYKMYDPYFNANFDNSADYHYLILSFETLAQAKKFQSDWEIINKTKVNDYIHYSHLALQTKEGHTLLRSGFKNFKTHYSISKDLKLMDNGEPLLKELTRFIPNVNITIKYGVSVLDGHINFFASENDFQAAKNQIIKSQCASDMCGGPSSW